MIHSRSSGSGLHAEIEEEGSVSNTSLRSSQHHTDFGLHSRSGTEEAQSEHVNCIVRPDAALHNRCLPTVRRRRIRTERSVCASALTSRLSNLI